MIGVKLDKQQDNKVAVYLAPDEIDLLKWVWANYEVFSLLRQATIKNGSATINYDPQGNMRTVVTNVTIYKLDSK